MFQELLCTDTLITLSCHKHQKEEEQFTSALEPSIMDEGYHGQDVTAKDDDLTSTSSMYQVPLKWKHNQYFAGDS